MKTFLKVLAALAAVAGVVYVIATFGDRIVAWAKNLLGRCHADEDVCCDACDYEDTPDLECTPAKEPAEAPAAAEAGEEAVQADEADFEG